MLGIYVQYIGVKRVSNNFWGRVQIKEKYKVTKFNLLKLKKSWIFASDCIIEKKEKANFAEGNHLMRKHMPGLIKMITREIWKLKKSSNRCFQSNEHARGRTEQEAD